MPLYMDLHKADGLTAEDVIDAHNRDLQVQEKYGVQYLTAWFNQGAGRVFCLVHAPSRQAAINVHDEAHGLLADEIIEVQEHDVEAFLGTARPRVNAPEPAPPEAEGSYDTAFRTLLFTDVEDSVATTQRLGDKAAMELLRTHNSIVRDALGSCSGTEVKHTGDGMMASFVTSSRAVDCSVAVQRALRDHEMANPEQAIRVRVGLSAGEPVVEGQDFFGAAVQLARRVCDRAAAGEILVANVVRELCIGKDFTFEDRGTHELKGFLEPQRLYAVHWWAQ